MPLRTNYTTGEPDPAGAINTTNADVNTLRPRTSTKALGVGEIVLNVMDFGAVGDGVADDSAAVTAAVLSANSSGRVKGIYFPGSFLIGSGHVFTKTVRLFGDSPDASNIKVKDGSTGDVFTFNARTSTIENLAIDGNRDNVTSGDTVVFNAGYPVAQRLFIANSAGTAIRVGKTARAIVARMSQVMTRTSRDYGIWVQQDSTDGQWSDLDIGTPGLSGIRIESSSQNMSNVHAWGCGVRMAAGDASGFMVTSSGHQLANCQAETCWEDGFTFRDNNQNGAMLSSCKSWANGWAGFNFQSYNKASMAACTAYDNGLRNTAGDASSTFAGIRNFESNHLSVSACKTFDREVARTVTAPAPVMSKADVVTQVMDYCEDGTSAPHSGSFAGNGFIRPDGVKFLGNGSVFDSNRVFNTAPPTIALTGNTLAIRANHKIVKVSGTGSFNALPTDMQVGRIVTLMFDAAGISIFENGNIKLASAFGSAADRQITLQWNGTKAVELARV